MKVKDLGLAKFNLRKIAEKRLDMPGKALWEFDDLSGVVFNLR